MKAAFAVNIFRPYTYTYTHIHIHLHTHIHIYTYTYTLWQYTYMHTYIHVQIYKSSILFAFILFLTRKTICFYRQHKMSLALWNSRKGEVCIYVYIDIKTSITIFMLCIYIYITIYIYVYLTTNWFLSTMQIISPNKKLIKSQKNTIYVIFHKSHVWIKKAVFVFVWENIMNFSEWGNISRG